MFSVPAERLGTVLCTPSPNQPLQCCRPFPRSSQLPPTPNTLIPLRTCITCRRNVWRPPFMPSAHQFPPDTTHKRLTSLKVPCSSMTLNRAARRAFMACRWIWEFRTRKPLGIAYICTRLAIYFLPRVNSYRVKTTPGTFLGS